MPLEEFLPVPAALARRPDLSSTEKLVAGVLMRWRREDGSAYRSQRLIAEDLGLSSRSVRDALSKLAGKGLLQQVEGGRNRATKYLFLDAPSARNNAHSVGSLTRNTARYTAHPEGGITRTGVRYNAHLCASGFPPIEERKERVREGALLEEFLDRYPKKTHQHLAAQLWLSIVTEEDERKVLEGLDRWKASAEWLKDGGKYIPRPDRWITERRWLDFPEPAIQAERTPDFDAEVA